MHYTGFRYGLAVWILTGACANDTEPSTDQSSTESASADDDDDSKSKDDSSGQSSAGESGQEDSSEVCPTGQISCEGQCIDPSADERFCGAQGTCQGTEAGVSCRVGELCITGQCTLACAGDQLLCDERCVDPSTHPDYCGAWGNCMGG